MMDPKDWLTRDELAAVTDRSDLRAWWIVACQHAQVAALFALMALWPNVLTLLVGTLLLGNRQLGFGVIVHECGHRTLFRNQRLNEFVGTWLAAPPTFNNMHAYMRGHLQHHRLAGTQDDPDLPNYRDYPITRERLKRKLKRDLTGQTGWRSLKGIGKALRRWSDLNGEQRAVLARGLGWNLGLLLLCTAVGAPWLYLTWLVAFVFVFQAVTRIRQVSEHAAVPDLYDADPRLNTRTIRANLLWRALFSPHGVNWHLEHHMLASVPIYRLPLLHRLLAEKGAYDGVHFPANHIQLLREVTTPVPAPA